MRLFHLFGISTAITLFAVVLTTIYYPASFNKEGIACISTNSYGEHWIELIWISVGFLIFLHFVWGSFKERCNTSIY
jgi:uncharacterized membrane protein